MKLSIILPVFLAAPLIAHGATTTLPFSTDFDSGVTVGPSSDPTNTFYTAGTTTTAPALTAGPDRALRLVSPAGQNSSAAIQLPSALTSGGFTITTTFTIVATSGTGNKNIAIGFLGDNSGNDLSLNNNCRMNYGIDTGIISFQNNGGSTFFDGTDFTYTTATWASGADRPTVGDSITFSMTAVYLSATRVSLTGTASTDAGAAPVSITAIMETNAGSNAYTGTNFGVRSGSAASNSSTIDFTSFSVTAIPEPGALTLLGVCGSLFLLRRKRA